jgi:alpha-beta hydrolase superfamily lysophospholipase
VTALLTRNEGRIWGVGRLRLNYRTWEVPRPRAGLVIIHGLSDHGGRYGPVAERLASYGISSFALDLRGHGLSEGRRGHAPRFDTLLQDLDRFRREVQGLVDLSTPVFLLGHSMGGLLVLRYLEEYDAPVRGGIVISPWLATAVTIPRWKITLANALARLLPAIPFRAHIAADLLSNDPDVVRAYRDDPLVHDIITPRLFVGVAAAMGLVLQRSDRLGVPLLFILAGADELVDTERSRAFARSITGADVTIREYPASRHEALNEPDRHIVLRDIGDWLASKL